MKKAYVLMSKLNGVKEILGVFSSKRKINDAISWIIRNDTYYKRDPDALSVDEFELNGERIEK